MASVIKAVDSARSIQQVAYNLDDLTQQANGYLDKVRIQAAQIIVEAQKQADLIKQRARDEGQASARAAAEQVLDEKIGKQMQSLLPAIKQTVAELHDAKQAWLKQWERGAIELAARVAAKILRRELTHDPSLPVQLVREALNLSAGTSQLRIQLNPQDHATLGAQIRVLVEELGQISITEIVADPNVSQGGSRVVTAQGEIDLRLETQLQRIIDELVDDES